jgi:hypothetical protein
MTDPFFMIMMMKNLGREYIVWGQGGGRCATSSPRAERSSHASGWKKEAVRKAREATANGEKFEPTFKVEIVDAEGVTGRRRLKRRCT